MSNNIDKAATGCALLIMGGLAIGWLAFIGWLLYTLAEWVTSK